MNLTSFIFPKLRTLKTWLDNSLKSLVSDDPLTRNIINVPKHCWSPHQSTFIIFLNHCRGNWVGKSLSYWYAKSWDCLLTHWLPMKSILFLIETIYRYQFRCNYLRKNQRFLNFRLHFWNLDQFSNVLKNKDTLTDFVSWKLRTQKT